MKKLTSLFLMAALAIIFMACGEKKAPTLSESITKDNMDQVIEKITKDEVQKPEDVRLFIDGLTRIAAEDKKGFEGKTVQEIIDAQRALILENEVISMNQRFIRMKLAMNHTFNFLGIVPQDNEKGSVNFIFFEITNKSDKDIKNLQGALQFYGGQTLVKNFPLIAKNVLKPGEVIKVGETKRLAIPFQNDPTSPRDKAVRENLKQLTKVWQPTLIEFTDGKVISIEQAPKAKLAKGADKAKKN